MALDYALADAGSTEASRQLSLAERVRDCRALSLSLTRSLSDEDQVVQSCQDCSPTKWHLAHTTWFFEELLLKPHLPGYQIFDDTYSFCFNSYYESVGPRHPRPQRGLLTRPSLERVRDYRSYVDDALYRFFDSSQTDEPDHDIVSIIETGISHEQQHQELALMDILNLFSAQPLKPAYAPACEKTLIDEAKPIEWIAFDGGMQWFGHDGQGFAYDNEAARHQQFLRPYRLSDRLVTNGEWIAFMEDGGYQTASLWLADGWTVVQQEKWKAPLYWERKQGGWVQMSLRGGLQPVERAAPVRNISYYEANAFSRWAGKRLPTEFEWEAASNTVSIDGNFLRNDCLETVPVETIGGDHGHGAAKVRQMFGDVWEWTQSHYSPYPGYRAPDGAIGEYNGKFMCGQFVLRGGACVTPIGHMRRTYRNFFFPHNRWQFGGLRLADDG